MTVESRTPVDLICLGYNPWSRMWKRNQQMVWGLSREPWIGNALFVNPGIWGSNLLFKPHRSFDFFARNNWSAIVPRRVSRNVTVYTRLHFPLSGRVATLSQAEVDIARRVIRNRVSEPFMLLVNRPEQPDSPLAADLMARAVLKVFDWSDDFESFSSTEEERVATRVACEHYLRACDLSLAVNERLGARARALSPSAHVIRNGTDVESFGRVLRAEVQIAPQVRDLPRPIIGYVGYRVADRLDLELIDFLAAARPGWTFAFVGPKVGEEPLKDLVARRANIRLIDPVDYYELPSLVAGFAACILPNRINTHTAGNDPIKLYDYLAAGKPVVSTAVAGSDTFGEMIDIAEAGAPFLQALERVISTDSPDKQARRHQAARAHSWQARTGVVADLIYKALLAKGARVTAATS